MSPTLLLRRLVAAPPARAAIRVGGWFGLGALWIYTALMLLLVGLMYASFAVFMIWAPYALYTHDHLYWAIIVASVVAWTAWLGWNH